MTDRKFFGTNELVESFVKTLKKIETLDGGWTIKYAEKNTGQEWLKYSVDPDRGNHFNLMLINPPLTTDQLIDIALMSKYRDEVSASAYRLHLEERYEGKEYRLNLIDRLLQINLKMLDHEEKERIKTIIQAGQLLDTSNNRDTLGKHYTEINTDANFFRDIADKAKTILAQLDK